MLTLNVRRIAQLKGIAEPYAFLTQRGFTHHTAKKLLAGAMLRPHVDDIEKLCRVFRCTPHDLLDYHPPKNLLNDAPDPLAFLTKPPLTADIHSIISTLSLADVQALTAEAQRRAAAT